MSGCEQIEKIQAITDKQELAVYFLLAVLKLGVKKHDASVAIDEALSLHKAAIENLSTLSDSSIPSEGLDLELAKYCFCQPEVWFALPMLSQYLPGYSSIIQRLLDTSWEPDDAFGAPTLRYQVQYETKLRDAFMSEDISSSETRLMLLSESERSPWDLMQFMYIAILHSNREFAIKAFKKIKECILCNARFAAVLDIFLSSTHNLSSQLPPEFKWLTKSMQYLCQHHALLSRGADLPTVLAGLLNPERISEIEWDLAVWVTEFAKLGAFKEGLALYLKTLPFNQLTSLFAALPVSLTDCDDAPREDALKLGEIRDVFLSAVAESFSSNEQLSLKISYLKDLIDHQDFDLFNRYDFKTTQQGQWLFTMIKRDIILSNINKQNIDNGFVIALVDQFNVGGDFYMLATLVNAFKSNQTSLSVLSHIVEKWSQKIYRGLCEARPIITLPGYARLFSMIKNPKHLLLLIEKLPFHTALNNKDVTWKDLKILLPLFKRLSRIKPRADVNLKLFYFQLIATAPSIEKLNALLLELKDDLPKDQKPLHHFMSMFKIKEFVELIAQNRPLFEQLDRSFFEAKASPFSTVNLLVKNQVPFWFLCHALRLECPDHTPFLQSVYILTKLDDAFAKLPVSNRRVYRAEILSFLKTCHAQLAVIRGWDHQVEKMMTSLKAIAKRMQLACQFNRYLEAHDSPWNVQLSHHLLPTHFLDGSADELDLICDDYSALTLSQISALKFKPVLFTSRLYEEFFRESIKEGRLSVLPYYFCYIDKRYHDDPTSRMLSELGLSPRQLVDFVKTMPSENSYLSEDGPVARGFRSTILCLDAMDYLVPYLNDPRLAHVFTAEFFSDLFQCVSASHFILKFRFFSSSQLKLITEKFPTVFEEHPLLHGLKPIKLILKEKPNIFVSLVAFIKLDTSEGNAAFFSLLQAVNASTLSPDDKLQVIAILVDRHQSVFSNFAEAPFENLMLLESEQRTLSAAHFLTALSPFDRKSFITNDSFALLCERGLIDPAKILFELLDGPSQLALFKEVANSPLTNLYVHNCHGHSIEEAISASSLSQEQKCAFSEVLNEARTQNRARQGQLTHAVSFNRIEPLVLSKVELPSATYSAKARYLALGHWCKTHPCIEDADRAFFNQIAHPSRPWFTEEKHFKAVLSFLEDFASALQHASKMGVKTVSLSRAHLKQLAACPGGVRQALSALTNALIPKTLMNVLSIHVQGFIEGYAYKQAKLLNVSQNVESHIPVSKVAALMGFNLDKFYESDAYSIDWASGYDENVAKYAMSQLHPEQLLSVLMPDFPFDKEVLSLEIDLIDSDQQKDFKRLIKEMARIGMIDGGIGREGVADDKIYKAGFQYLGLDEARIDGLLENILMLEPCSITIEPKALYHDIEAYVLDWLEETTNIARPREHLGIDESTIWELLTCDKPEEKDASMKDFHRYLLTAPDGLALVKRVIDSKSPEERATVTMQSLLYTAPGASTNLYREFVRLPFFTEWFFGFELKRPAENVLAFEPSERALCPLNESDFEAQIQDELEVSMHTEGGIVFWLYMLQQDPTPGRISFFEKILTAYLSEPTLMRNCNSMAELFVAIKNNKIRLASDPQESQLLKTSVNSFLDERVKRQRERGLWRVYWQTLAMHQTESENPLQLLLDSKEAAMSLLKSQNYLVFLKVANDYKLETESLFMQLGEKHEGFSQALMGFQAKQARFEIVMPQKPVLSAETPIECTIEETASEEEKHLETPPLEGDLLPAAMVFAPAPVGPRRAYVGAGCQMDGAVPAL